MHAGIAYLRWRGKRSRHSRRMRTPNFAYLVRGPLSHHTESNNTSEAQGQSVNESLHSRCIQGGFSRLSVIRVGQSENLYCCTVLSPRWPCSCNHRALSPCSTRTHGCTLHLLKIGDQSTSLGRNKMAIIAFIFILCPTYMAWAANGIRLYLPGLWNYLSRRIDIGYNDVQSIAGFVFFVKPFFCVTSPRNALKLIAVATSMSSDQITPELLYWHWMTCYMIIIFLMIKFPYFIPSLALLSVTGKATVVTMLTLSLLIAQQVVITTTRGAVTDDKVGIMSTLDFVTLSSKSSHCFYSFCHYMYLSVCIIQHTTEMCRHWTLTRGPVWRGVSAPNDVTEYPAW